jgi:hypothetical protein
LPEIPANAALYGLMGVNGAVFLLWRADPRFTALNFTTSLDHIRAGRLHTLVTCAFSQRDSMHLLSNMVGLFFFGRSVSTCRCHQLLREGKMKNDISKVCSLTGVLWWGDGKRENMNNWVSRCVGFLGFIPMCIKSQDSCRAIHKALDCNYLHLRTCTVQA